VVWLTSNVQMLIFAFFLALAAAAPSPQEGGSEGTEIISRISATGGGIVKEGQAVTLTYKPQDESWDRCSWSLQKEDKTLKCIFDINTDDGSVDRSKCNSNEFKDTLEYVGTSIEECSISVKSVRRHSFKSIIKVLLAASSYFQVSLLHNGTWVAQAGFDDDIEIAVVVAEDVKSVEIKAEDLTLGEEGKVTCTIQGGRPAPYVSFTVDGLAEESLISGATTTSQTANEDGVYESVLVNILKGLYNLVIMASSSFILYLFLYFMVFF